MKIALHGICLSVVLISALPADEVTNVIPLGSEWRYLDNHLNPVESANNPALFGSSNWRAGDYQADAAGTPETPNPWKIGRAVFGYGDTLFGGYGQQLLFGTDANIKSITYYFWKRFQLPPNQRLGETYNQIRLGIVRDDGVAVYINGHEVRRDNLPAKPAPISHTTLATSAVDGTDETRIVETAHNPLNIYDSNNPGQNILKEGDNVIAVELHQASVASSDTTFDLSLDLVLSDACLVVARPGIVAAFETTANNERTATGLQHLRPDLKEPTGPDFSFAGQDTELNWTSRDDTGGLRAGITAFELFTNAPLANQAYFVTNTHAIWESEILDIRNFRNVTAFLSLQATKRPSAAFSVSDWITATFIVSMDGAAFQSVPWLTFSAPNAPQVPVQWSDLVNESAQKTALVPTSDTDPPISGAGNWRKLTFPDASWPTGGKGAGFDSFPGTPPSLTGYIDPNFDFKDQLFNTRTVIYMRCRFPFVADRTSYDRLQLRVRYNDGFVAYLNDQEVVRRNFTGTPNSTSRANSQTPKSSSVIWEDFDITGHLNKLNLNAVNQDNILAVHALNSAVGSSTMLIWPMLQIGKTTRPFAAVSSLDDGNAATFLELNSNEDQNPPANRTLIPEGARSVRLRIEANASSENVAYYFDNITFLGDPIVPDSFDVYTAAKLPLAPAAERSANADPDGDGVPNLLEFAFGSDPSVAKLNVLSGEAEVSILPVASVENGYGRFTFRAPGPLPFGNPDTGFESGGLNLRPQISFGDLTAPGTWRDGINAGGTFFIKVMMEPANDGTDSVLITCRTVAPLAELSASKEIFMRLRVAVVRPTYLQGSLPECPY
ncbi:MAG: hypothetical protein ACR2OZ_00065 [Verrucomicrobiales bacterium]